MRSFDVVVVGGGHAGVEAACAAARMGAQVALVTFAPANIGTLSCNPAIGGIGKGHLVREVDAFDGVIARAADVAAIHHRMLNRSKGPAVHGPRVQVDRQLFARALEHIVRVQRGLTIIAGECTDLLASGGAITGVEVGGTAILGRAVILATGTFLGGRLFHGLQTSSGGRVGEGSAIRLAAALRERVPELLRSKTGTPPRLDGRTIDWSRLDRQRSDADPWTMSVDSGPAPPQLACAITHTNLRTHELIANARESSPLYAGLIEGRGPRYCPSIEDKIVRFADRSSHQIFLEPEGLANRWIYPNGISTSLPAEVQMRFVRSIAGLEQAEITQPGYAVEYDHVDPRALDRTLSVLGSPGLYLAGQINGTTGYEEASAQGLVAGLNAARFAAGSPGYIFDRSRAYIGVMIDDLVTHGASEPYRMLTARAEHRLHLRADNAETRLARDAESLGLLSPKRLKGYSARAERLDALRGGDAPRLPGDDALVQQIEADRLYAPYLEREDGERERLAREDALPLHNVDFAAIAGLSTEMRERLSAAAPASLGEARAVRGVTPAALAALLVAGHTRR